MTITVVNKHDNHPTSVHLTQNRGPHYAALRCIKCNKHIQWLSRQDAEKLLNAI
jgi:hypothetical protein